MTLDLSLFEDSYLRSKQQDSHIEKTVDRKLYCFLLFVELSLFVFSVASLFNGIVFASINMIVALAASFYRYRKTEKVICPLTIFSIIWLLLMALTSFEFPLMRSMTVEDWQYVLLFSISFLFFGLLSSFFNYPEKHFVGYSSRINDAEYLLSLLLIVLGIGIHLYQVYKYGGFVIFSDNPSEESSTYTIGGLSTLSTLGSLGIFNIFGNKKYMKKPSYILLSLVYLVLLLLVGVRFQIFLTVIMLFSKMAFLRIKGRHLLFLAFAIGALAATFFFVSYYRSGTEHAIKYYISTGKYSGAADDIVSTEIFRYFGYGQRLCAYYFYNYSPGVSSGAYTIYPLAHLFHFPLSTPTRIWENGYVATNMVVYLYCDFGVIWPIIAGLYSLIVNCAYYFYLNNTKSAFREYLWAVCCFSLSMSFYAYLHHYIYIIIYFPIVLFAIKILSRGSKNF